MTGHLPLWNPYLNFGLPLYADPGFAFWEPITWLFGFIGYNIYTLTIEVLLYIWLAGVFMFELGKYFRHSTTVCFLMAIMYMCCGFFVGNLQHINFLTSAAFLPIVVKTFLQLQERFQLQEIILLFNEFYFLVPGRSSGNAFCDSLFFGLILILFLLSMRDKTK